MAKQRALRENSKCWAHLNEVSTLRDAFVIFKERNPEFPLRMLKQYRYFLNLCVQEVLKGNDARIPYVGTLKVRERTLKPSKSTIMKRGLFIGKGGKMNGGKFFVPIKENMRRLGYIYNIRLEGDYQRSDMNFKAGQVFRDLLFKILTETDQPFTNNDKQAGIN